MLHCDYEVEHVGSPTLAALTEYEKKMFLQCVYKNIAECSKHEQTKVEEKNEE